MFLLCSRERRAEHPANSGGWFFTGARAARFPSPVTPNFSSVRKSSHGPYRARSA